MIVFELILTFFHRFATQLIMAMLMFAPALKRRKFFWLRFIPSLSVYCAFPYAITGFGLFSVYRNPFLYIGWLNLNWALVLAVGMLLMMLCFKIKVSEMLFYGTSAYAMQHCARKLADILNYAFSFRDMARIMTIIITCAILYVLFYFILVRRLRHSENLGIKDIYTIAVSIITIVVVYVLSVFVNQEGESTNYSGKIYAIICCVLLLALQFGLFEHGKKEREKFEIEKMLHNEQELHRISGENIDLINIKCHDLKRQISAIRKLTDEEQRESSLREIEKAVLIYDGIAKTGNDTVDLVVSEKSLLCEKHDIKFSYIVDAKDLDTISELDLYSLLGNALDNAIEEVVKIPDPEKRIISLNISINGQLIYIHVENYTESKITFKNGLPETTKEDKRYHGYGVKSMKYIANKYKGHLKIHVDDNTFNLDMIIPVKRKKV